MCLIIHKPAQADVPEDLLASAAEFNPHGFGLMTFGADRGITVRRRSQTRLPELKRRIEELEAKVAALMGDEDDEGADIS